MDTSSQQPSHSGGCWQYPGTPTYIRGYRLPKTRSISGCTWGMRAPLPPEYPRNMWPRLTVPVPDVDCTVTFHSRRGWCMDDGPVGHVTPGISCLKRSERSAIWQLFRRLSSHFTDLTQEGWSKTGGGAANCLWENFPLEASLLKKPQKERRVQLRCVS